MIIREAIVLLLIMSLFSCSEADEEKDSSVQKVDPSLEVIDSVYLYRIDSTGLVYEVNSPQMLIKYHNSYVTEEHPNGLSIVFYNRDAGESSITAGYSYTDKDFMTILKDDVRIVSDRGDVLETSFLKWDRRNRTIQTDKLVKLIQMSGDTSFGFGLQANEDFSRFRIKNGYAGKVQFEDLKQKLGLD